MNDLFVQSKLTCFYGRFHEAVSHPVRFFLVTFHIRPKATGIEYGRFAKANI